MNTIKRDLKNLVENTMLPEVEAYSNNLLILLEEKRATKEDMVLIKEMESFLVELQNIVEAIDTDMISDTQAQEVYGNMVELISESEGDGEIRA